jgi:hypothetical protein
VILNLCGFIVRAQQGNPFDIKSRLIPVGQPEQQEVTKVPNLISSDTTLDNALLKPDQADSISETSVNEVSDSMHFSGFNPFEISSGIEPEQRIKQEPEQKSFAPDLIEVPDVPEQSKASTPLFVFWILLFTIIILASILNLKRNSFSNLYRSISNENYLRLIQREENNGYSPLFIILNGLFYINGGLFLFLAFAHFGHAVDFNFFAIISFILFLIYLLRNLGMGFLAYVFPISKEANQYNFTVILYNNFIGILLIVLNLIIAYSPSGIATFFLYLGFIMFGLFYLLRLFRGFLNSASFISNHFFHFFLYLCTFEIATVFILIKGVQIWIS